MQSPVQSPHCMIFPPSGFPLEILAKGRPVWCMSSSEHGRVCRCSKSWQLYLLTSFLSAPALHPWHRACFRIPWVVLELVVSFLTSFPALCSPPFTLWSEQFCKGRWAFPLLPVGAVWGPCHPQHIIRASSHAVEGTSGSALYNLVSQHVCLHFMFQEYRTIFNFGNIPCSLILLYLCSCFSFFLGSPPG